MPPIQALPAETAKRLSSAQVAFSPDTVVKELVENALDAGASNVHVRVKDAGLALVSVKDDGTGIPVDDMPLVLQRYTTSKISSVEDLADVQTFGFRGEALNSIASLSQRTTICTRTEQEETGRIYEYDHHRRITSETTRAMQRGTQIDVEKLFHHLPVRKQLFSKESQQTCKRIKDLLIGFALLCPKTRIVLKFERSTNSSSSDESANGISKSSVSTTLVRWRHAYLCSSVLVMGVLT
ncbi:PMS1 nirs variant 6 [Entophlyctis helioformis]|nr:PMS1 nirs variant 6 [Entophlyctis helioformis]